MNNIIYCSIIVPASKSADNIPERVVATQEVNGCAVWRDGHDGQKLLTFTYSFDARDKAIEFAVDKARELRGDTTAADFLSALGDAVFHLRRFENDGASRPCHDRAVSLLAKNGRAA